MLSTKQKQAYDSFLQGKNIFVTGPGGSGKSYLVQYILENSKKKIAVTAMTGCAAILLGCGARTLHSWAGIGLGESSTDMLVSRIKRKQGCLGQWKKTDVLIIDEVSMMKVSLFQKLNEIAKKLRKNEKPFGGMQLILLGDFCQLPPVSKGLEEEPFLFESDTWEECIEKVIYLDEIKRQSDTTFQTVLNKIRLGDIDDDVETFLHSRVQKSPTICTKMYPTNNKVDNLNYEELEKIKDVSVIHRATHHLEQTVNSRSYSIMEIENEVKNMHKNCPYDELVELKKGAQVILIANMSIENGLVNGSQGIITKFEGTIPVVKFLNGKEIPIDVYEWESTEIPELSIRQIPLRLAWAISIHKCQGMTLDTVDIDVGRSIFECGQAYVALSRVKTPEGLFIKSLDVSRIKVNPKVKEFYENLIEN